MKRILALAVLLIGCGGSSEPIDTATGEGNGDPNECAALPNGSECGDPSDGFNSGSCNAGTCVRYNDCAKMSEGDVCGGDESSGYYGRCRNGGCAWADYQCRGLANGTACTDVVKPDNVGGGTCQAEACCFFCVDKEGACAIVHYVDMLGKQRVYTGGKPCP